MVGEDPYWAQKRTAKKSKERILSALFRRPMTFTELRNEVRLSKPVLRNHLKFLKEHGDVARAIIDDKVVYRLTKESLSLPVLRTLILENSAYLRIAREFVEEREAYITKQRVFPHVEGRSELVYSELDPQFIAEKSEIEIIQAIDKWFTPIVLYAILQELKSGSEWTEIIHGLSEKLMGLVKQKDLSRFEEVLRAKYSKRLVQKYLFLPSERIPIIDSLDDTLGFIEAHQEIELYEEKMKWRQRKNSWKR